MKNEELLCFHCRSELPKASFNNLYNNELTNRIYGKLGIDFGTSFLYYYKSGITQKLLHQFKYNNYLELGELIGSWVGHELLKRDITEIADIIIPVPLHPKKERKRGYNQSHYFAKGISEVTNIPTRFNVLVRIQYQKSQTHKTKEQRWKSVADAFRVTEKEILVNKKVLLVDDVITTGATLEACGNQLLKCGISKSGIATMALAK